MNFSEQFIEVLDAISEKIGVTINWTADNVIPYLETLSQKLVNYEFYSSILFLILGIIAFIIGLIGCIKAMKALIKTNDDDFCVVVIVFGVILACGLLLIIAQSLDMITCVTFPEKIILNELQTYIS